MRWVDDSGYQLVGDSRELYHVWLDGGPNHHVTDLQLAIAKWALDGWVTLRRLSE